MFFSSHLDIFIRFLHVFSFRLPISVDVSTFNVGQTRPPFSPAPPRKDWSTWATPKTIGCWWCALGKQRSAFRAYKICLFCKMYWIAWIIVHFCHNLRKKMWKIAIFKIAELYCCLHRFCFCSKLQRPALEYVSMGCWRENIESPWIPSIEGRRLRLLGETVKRWSGKLMKLVVSSGADSQILRCLSSHFVKELTMRSTSC